MTLTPRGITVNNEISECQYHNNCGGYCETPEEQRDNLCENCLEAIKQDDADRQRLNALIAEAKEAVSFLDKIEAGDGTNGDGIRWIEAVARKLAAFHDQELLSQGTIDCACEELGSTCCVCEDEE